MIDQEASPSTVAGILEGCKQRCMYRRQQKSRDMDFWVLWGFNMLWLDCARFFVHFAPYPHCVVDFEALYKQKF